MRFGKFVFRLAAGLLAVIGASTAANATVVAYGDPAFPNVTAAPAGFVSAYYSDNASSDVGSQSPSNVLSVLSTWFGQSLTFISGGACGASPSYANGCTSYDLGGGNSSKGGVSSISAQLYGVHFGNRFIAFLYNGPVNGFQIDGLRFGVSNIYAFNAPQEVPLPGALWLMGAGLAGLGFARRNGKG